MSAPAILPFCFSLILSPAGQFAAERRATPVFWPLVANLIQDMADPPPKERPLLFLPPRSPEAMSGSQFLRATERMSLAAREYRVEREILAGNVPSFLRHYVPVRLVARLQNGMVLRGWAFTLPDYLAIGSDRDFIRVPMDPLTAQIIADNLDASLPTSKIVDATYASARIRLSPHPLPASGRMRRNDYLRRHEDFIKEQLRFQRPGEALVAGQKKDVVLSNRLASRPQRVAIYGWHMPGGQPIQPLSSVHKKSYSDYSHGLRPMARTVIFVHGRSREEWATDDILRHPSLWPLVSEEGPLAEIAIDPAEPEWTPDELKAPD